MLENDRTFVIPGQKISEAGNTECNLNCYFEDNAIISSVVGLAKFEGSRGNNIVNVIPSSGVYIPKPDDVVLAIIKREHSTCFELDINSPYECILLKEEFHENRKLIRREQEEKFKVGDLLSVKILSVNEINFSQAIKPWKLEVARVLEVNPKRVPRIIGRKKSMLSLLREKTKCNIIVGQNGRVWIKGKNEELAVRVIEKIVEEALTQGLTDRIEKFLDKEISAMEK
ncbi:MAG: KH domain-containing protein [Candidatus Altiarchaeota archaeon]